MKRRHFIIPILFLATCNQLVFGQLHMQDITGIYTYIHNKYDLASLELKQDSTFTYYWEWKGLKGLTSGKWNMDKKYLYLNSDNQPAIISDKIQDFYTIKAVTDTSVKGISIQLKDVNGLPIPNARCWIITRGKMLTGYSNNNGFVYFDVKNLKHISVDVPFAQNGFITYNDKYLNNKFEVTLLQVNQQYLYLTNEKLSLNRRDGKLFLHETFFDKKATNIFMKL